MALGAAKENIQVAIEEKVPFINYALGKPWFIDQVHAYGGKVIRGEAPVHGKTSLIHHDCRTIFFGLQNDREWAAFAEIVLGRREDHA